MTVLKAPVCILFLRFVSYDSFVKSLGWYSTGFVRVKCKQAKVTWSRISLTAIYGDLCLKRTSVTEQILKYFLPFVFEYIYVNTGQGECGWRTGSGWPLFAVGISRCSDKNFRNVPQSDPLAPAQLACWATIGSSGWQLSENCVCNLFALCSCLQLSPSVCLAMGQTQWLNLSVWPSPSLVTVKTTLASLHNGGWFLGDRHDR